MQRPCAPEIATRRILASLSRDEISLLIDRQNIQSALNNLCMRASGEGEQGLVQLKKCGATFKFFF